MNKPAKHYLTTGEAAAYCGVTLRTIINWIKQGRLKAYQLPGRRGDNRIATADLRTFMQANKMPIPAALLPGRAGAIGHNDRAPLNQQGEENNADARQAVALVVDDEESIAQTIAWLLQDQGFTTFAVNNSFHAGRLYEKHRPRLMTLDLSMPGVDGFALLKQLQGPRQCKILVISSLGEDQLHRAITLGADAVLSKPLDQDAFVAAVNKLMSAGSAAMVKQHR